MNNDEHMPEGCQDFHQSRRNFLISGLQLGALAPFILGGIPQLAFANVQTNKRLALVFLRGGLDALSSVVPYADPDYTSARGKLAYDTNDLIALDNFFALHQSLGGLHSFYKNGELAIIHALATPYRDRSHFDAQNLLENGDNAPHKQKSGWLNRAIDVMGGSHAHNNALGLSIGPMVQLLMQGDAKVTSWSPSSLQSVSSDLLERIAQMYGNDPLLSESLNTAKVNAGITSGIKGTAGGRGNAPFIKMMEAGAEFLSRPDGPRIAAIDFDGFDTHVRQQDGGKAARLPKLLEGLSDGIQAYRERTPDSVWRNTVIYVVTEFGRTVAPNGSGGTDHGTATLAMAVGGNIKGGRVISQWPGLSSSHLFEGRDLAPTLDLRAVSKNILMNHYDIPVSVIDRHILPGTLGIKPIEII